MDTVKLDKDPDIVYRYSTAQENQAKKANESIYKILSILKYFNFFELNLLLFTVEVSIQQGFINPHFIIAYYNLTLNLWCHVQLSLHQFDKANKNGMLN